MLEVVSFPLPDNSRVYHETLPFIQSRQNIARRDLEDFRKFIRRSKKRKQLAQDMNIDELFGWFMLWRYGLC